MNGSGKGQIAAYVAAAVLLLVGGAYLLRGEGAKPPAGGGVALDGAGGASEAGGGPARDAAGEGSTPSRPVFVHVAGAVRRPGIYRVKPGSRVAAAVRKAGGLTRRADLTAFNLAEGLRDSQQVIVPRRGEAAAAAIAGAAGAATAAAGPGGAGGAPGQPISLSTATPEQLDSIEGIGPKLAQAIIGYRDQHKGYKSIEELREVDGIGEKRFATLREAVRP